MIAKVEQPNQTYKDVEMGEPRCGEDFCDHCGDCLGCSQHDAECYDGHYPMWVIYLDNKKNPHYR